MAPPIQQDILLCTGVLATQPDTFPGPPLDLTEFRMVASVLGFILGVVSMAADLSGLVVLRIGVENATTEIIVMFTCCWSILVAVATWAIFSLIRRLIMMVLVNNHAEVLEALEGRCLIWSILGINFGYCLVDFFFLTTQKFLVSVVFTIATVAIYKAVLLCCACYEGHQSHVETKEHYVPLLMIV
jgi:hypothetical protein